jgi:hypothetical protein
VQNVFLFHALNSNIFDVLGKNVSCNEKLQEKLGSVLFIYLLLYIKIVFETTRSKLHKKTQSLP